MATVNALNGPRVSDTIVFDLETTDSDGNLIDPFKVDRITIYHLQRDFIRGNFTQFDKEIVEDEEKFETTFFSEAVVQEVFGNDIDPAWLSTDVDNAFIERTDVGKFELEWRPEFAREGDYIICWTWTPLAAGDSISNFFSFEVNADTKQTTVIPTHFTREGKYEDLLEAYTPEMFKRKLGDGDVTPTTINKFNNSIADGFTVLEDLANQIIDLYDANAVPNQLLQFLANLFNLSLKSNDTTRWRRQIKAAIPTYKQKGTLPGLIEVFDQAGIAMKKFTRLYQIVSPYTWQEAFTVEDGQTSWELEKVAITAPLDTDNFEVFFRANDSDSFIELTTDYVDFSTTEGVTTMTWVGGSLSFDPIILEDGDTVRIIYKVAEVSDQSKEDFIRSLPLADQRDDRDDIIPRKNWNVRVIEEDNEMLDVICSKRNPFRDPLVYGHIRTEFPYSENIYNMEEYNGCVVGNTKIITENGIKNIKDITQEDKKILTPFGFKRFEGLKNQGKKEILKIKTKMGREVSATYNHLFKTMNKDGKLEWKKACELKEGDYLLGKRNFENKKTQGTEEAEEDIWYLAGFLYGDSCLDKDRINWICPESEIESKYKIENILGKYKAKYSIFKCTPEIHQKHTNLKCNECLYIVRSSKNQLKEIDAILPKYEIKGRWKKHLPNLIWSADEKSKCAFLKGLFDTDGSVSKGQALLTTKWKLLAKEVQEILLSIGILSSVTKIKAPYKKENREYFRVRTLGELSAKTFSKKISFFVKSKKNAIEEGYFSTNVKGKAKNILNADRTIIPNACCVAKDIFPHRKRISKIKFAERSHKEKRIITLLTRLKQEYQKTIPDNCVEEILNKAIQFGNIKNKSFDFLNNYYNFQWFFDKVESISHCGKATVYDPINVEEVRSYISNGLVSHNSTRPSKEPCDIDIDFSDDCSCCLGSYYNIDLEIEELSNDRIDEARDVLQRYVPFHAIAHSINFTGSFNEFIVPPVERVEALIEIRPNDFIIAGQNVFTRTRSMGLTTNQIKRDALANSETVVVANGTALNNEIVLYSPGIRFDQLGIIEGSNILEILSGTHEGQYKAINPNKLSTGIEQIPDTISEPISTSSFPFRLSNTIFSGTLSSISQDDIFTLTDENISFRTLETQPGWKIEVTAPGSVVGTYEVIRTFPDDSVRIKDWPITTDLSSVTYKLKTNTDVEVASSTSGAVAVQRRGKVDGGGSIKTRFGAKEQDWLKIGTDQYQILEFETDEIFFIDGWTGGDVGATVAKIIRRLIDTTVGYLKYKGLKLEAPVDHETGLQISNGANNLGPLLENNRFKENHLVSIGGQFYQMVDIDKTTITLSGPMETWTTSGTPVQYSIIRYTKVSPITVDGVEFQRIDRRNNEIITVDIETATPMTATAAFLNDPDGVLDCQQIGENISVNIEWKN